jgi:hypothetical protein
MRLSCPRLRRTTQPLPRCRSSFDLRSRSSTCLAKMHLIVADLGVRERSQRETSRPRGGRPESEPSNSMDDWRVGRSGGAQIEHDSDLCSLPEARLKAETPLHAVYSLAHPDKAKPVVRLANIEPAAIIHQLEFDAV